VNSADFCARLVSECGVCVVSAGCAFNGDDKDDVKGCIRLPLGDVKELELGLPVIIRFFASYVATELRSVC
jgi:hypothetical protein